MMWLTWRQFRAQTIAASAALAVLAVILAVTGPHLAHLYDISGIATCNADVNCGTLTTSFLNKLGPVDPFAYFLGIAFLLAAPAIIGVFWGAPLVTREIEARTLPLAWNQSVSRTRWMAVKLGLIGLAAMATAGLLSLMLTWWSSPIDRAAGRATGTKISFVRLTFPLFSARGITPIAYAAFAFALGVTAGVLIRRTLPAMAATLAGFALAQIVMPNWIRPHFFAPAHAVVPLNTASVSGLTVGPDNSLILAASANRPGAWVMSSQIINTAGHQFNAATTHACLATESNGSFQACVASLGNLHLRQLISYQPASRFWAFQWYETAIFMVLALALAGFCTWWIGHHHNA